GRSVTVVQTFALPISVVAIAWGPASWPSRLDPSRAWPSVIDAETNNRAIVTTGVIVNNHTRAGVVPNHARTLANVLPTRHRPGSTRPRSVPAGGFPWPGGRAVPSMWGEIIRRHLLYTMMTVHAPT